MITSKLLVPATSPDLIPRPVLFEILHQGFQRKLIHISAPAGSGKSCLLSQWIHQQQIPAAWYSLDPRDNDRVDQERRKGQALA